MYILIIKIIKIQFKEENGDTKNEDTDYYYFF